MVERKIGGFFLFAGAGATKMLSNSGDMKLIDRRFLLRRLFAPVGRSSTQIGGFGMAVGNFRWGRVK